MQRMAVFSLRSEKEPVLLPIFLLLGVILYNNTAKHFSLLFTEEHVVNRSLSFLRKSKGKEEIYPLRLMYLTLTSQMISGAILRDSYIRATV